MRNVADCGIALRAVFCVVIALVSVVAPECAFAQQERTKIHSFWVAGSASVTEKADEAILIMVIRGTGPDVEGALAENQRITRQAYDALNQPPPAGEVPDHGNPIRQRRTHGLLRGAVLSATFAQTDADAGGELL